MCWENINADAGLRGAVQNSIQATWGSVSQANFTGWGACPSGFFGGIRILVEDSPNNGAHVKALGNDLINVANGMSLNFTMQNWNSNCPGALGLNNCVTWVAIHEFGHALGFTHEQNRPDTPSSCTNPPQGTSGNAIFTDWDLNSIMNYCNPSYNGNGLLSSIDILTTQTYYGRIPSYNGTTSVLQIPVVQVGSTRYTATLSDANSDGRFTLDAASITTNKDRS